jgi:hypothetical protein
VAEHDEAEPTWLTPLWQAASENWANEAMHKAILAACQSPERLAEVARRYRTVLDDPVREPMAKRQLEAIVGLAFAQLERRSAPPEKSRAWHWLFLLLLLAVVVAVARTL